MRTSIVVAASQNNVIGKNGSLLWNIPKDLRHFREITLNHHVLMGRKTYESIQGSIGGPLPRRVNLVLSRDNNHQIEGCLVFNDLQKAVNFAEENGEEELMVIGGEQVYKLSLPMTDSIYLTRILKYFDGDALFPKLDMKEWRPVSRELHLDSEIPFAFIKLERSG